MSLNEPITPEELRHREEARPPVELMDAQTPQSALFIAGCHLKAALKNLHDAETQLEWLAENGCGVNAEGFGAAVSHLARIHGRVLRADMALAYPGVGK